MTESLKSKTYDLEERSYGFAKRCRELVKKLPKTIQNIEDGKQLIRSSGSQAANYVEANESLSKRDFCLRIKICRKESKESRLWLRLVDTSGRSDLEGERSELANEAIELTKIYNAIVSKSL